MVFKLQICCQTPAEMLEERMANTSSRQRQTTTSSNYQIGYFWHDCCILWYIVVIQYRCCKIFLVYLFAHFKLNEVDTTGMDRRKTSIDRKQNTMVVSYCFVSCHSWYVRTHPYESRLPSAGTISRSTLTLKTGSPEVGDSAALSLLTLSLGLRISLFVSPCKRYWDKSAVSVVLLNALPL